MQSTVSMAQARESFSDLVNRVAFGRERFVVERRGKALATLMGAAEYQQLMELLSEKGINDEIRGIPVRLRFDGERYFVSDDAVSLYGVGDTPEEARQDYLLAAQDLYADLSANADRLAPYLQDQLNYLHRALGDLDQATQ